MAPQASIGYINDTGTSKGRGVFAFHTIKPGEIIEICPVIKLETPFNELPEEIQRVVFHWGVLAQMQTISGLALGYGSMYNHANPANARYKASPDGDLLVISANVKIEKGDEITINYNASEGEPQSNEDNWFALTGVTPYMPPTPGQSGG